MTERMRTVIAFTLLGALALAGQSWAGGYDRKGQTQHQGQAQGQIQGQVALGGYVSEGAVNIDQGSSNTLSVNERHRRNAPAIFAPSINPSHPCALSWSVGGSGTGGGGLLGRSYKDQGCELRETARLFADMGHTDIAMAMLCNSQAVQGYAKGKEKEAGIGKDQCLALAQLQDPSSPEPSPVVVNVEAPDCGVGEKLRRCEEVTK